MTKLPIAGRERHDHAACPICGFHARANAPLPVCHDGPLGTRIRKRLREATRLVALSTVFVTVSCEWSNAVSDLQITLMPNADGTELMLSHSLFDIAGSNVGVHLAVDIEMGGADDSVVVHPADVASLSGGRFVVLDRADATLNVFDPTGELVARADLKGGGPGEFDEPIGMTAIQDRIIVFQLSATRSLTSLTPSGQLLATVSSPIAGDWSTARTRAPRLLMEAPLGHTAEDWTRRIGPYDDTSFVFQIQPDELAKGTFADEYTPSAALVRFNRDLTVIDTVVVLPAAPIRQGTQVVANQLTRVEEPIFASRPQWAGGDGWFAIGHGDSSSVVVRLDGEGGEVRISWPDQVIEITDEHKLARARWSGEHTLRTMPSARENFSRMSEREVERQYRAHAARLPFADLVPKLMALHGSGQCLWLVGFNPEDYADGSGLTLVAVNVRERTLVGLVRLPRSDTRVRHVDQRGIYATYRDQDNVFRVVRYAYNGDWCGDA